MTIQTVPDTQLRYYLISHDKDGRERNDDPDAPNGKLSTVVEEIVAREPVTDVFFISHGWKGDVPAAVDQCDRWIAAMATCTDDRRKVRELRPGFRSLLIGLHWPSLPWGDEEHAAGGMSFAPGGATSVDDLIESAADGIADSERARGALRTIFESALEDIAPDSLPAAVAGAYRVLHEEAGLAADGPSGAPGDDAEAFDPDSWYRDAMEEDAISFGGAGLGGMLTLLRQLSFWKMKKRARTFGERGAADLLRSLQQKAGPEVKFHLMGHSFGCIVTSAAIAGAGGDAPLPRPVDSVFLVQGALSFWSYCDDIPVTKGKAGYFRSIADKDKVAGPLLTTQSEHDTAVGKLYPLAAGLKRQVVFAPGELPKYGALGTFGARGPGIEVEDLSMHGILEPYDFQPGKIYNLESSGVISEGGGLSGAHSDIAKPEVAHAFWSAVIR